MATDRRVSSPSLDGRPRALGQDRDSFEADVSPYRDALLRAATLSIERLKEAGRLRPDVLNPQQLVGETLIRAFDGRRHYPSGRMRLLTWLLSIQQRALNRIASEERQYQDRKAFSLDEEVAQRNDVDGIDAGFFGADEPFEIVTYEDLIPSTTPDEVEVDARRPLTEEELQFLEEAGLEPETRQIVEFHDEFDLPVSDVAHVLEYGLHDIAEALNQARVHVRQWIGSSRSERADDA